MLFIITNKDKKKLKAKFKNIKIIKENIVKLYHNCIKKNQM